MARAARQVRALLASVLAVTCEAGLTAPGGSGLELAALERRPRPSSETIAGPAVRETGRPKGSADATISGWRC